MPTAGLAQGDLLSLATRAAQEGGRIIREHFGKPLIVQSKGRAGAVTDADLESEAAIIRILTEGSNYAIYSEERGHINGATRRTWIIDPLDGTSNLLLGIPYVATAIVLVQGHETLLAVVHNPLANVTYVAEREGGCLCNGHLTRVATSPSRLDHVVLAWVQGYLSRRARAAASTLQRRLEAKVFRVLSTWAPTLDWCLLASGKISGVISFDSEIEEQYAGALIAQEAGAIVTDFNGRPYSNWTRRILATNAMRTHRQVSIIIRRFGSERER